MISVGLENPPSFRAAVFRAGRILVEFAAKVEQLGLEVDTGLVCRGEGEETDIQTLEAIGSMMKGFALCALGTTAPNPILSTIKYFRGEYEAHIRDRRCPAAVCRELVHFRILPDHCTGCTACAAVCPSKAIRGEKKQAHTVDDALCTKCGLCLEACKHDAIVKE